jgi:hypothetical protein
MATSPATHPDIYKTLIVNGGESPGAVKLSGFDFEQDWEEQKAKGSTGATSLNRGRKLVKFTATFMLADLEDVEAWETFHRTLRESVEGPKPKALLIFHPDLMRQGAIDFVVTSIGGMAHDGKGGSTVTCKFLEYRPPKPRPAAKADAGAGTRRGTTTVNDPNAARKAELAALLEQAKAP